MLALLPTQKLEGFAARWALWPRKDARKDSEKAWHQIVTTKAIEQKIDEAMAWQVPMLAQRERHYIPLFATWIRGERFNDERPMTTPNRLPAKVLTPMALHQMDAANRIRSLVALGVSPEDAKLQVYKEMGWVK